MQQHTPPYSHPHPLHNLQKKHPVLPFHNENGKTG